MTPSPYLPRRDPRTIASAQAEQLGWSAWSYAPNASEHVEPDAFLVKPVFEGPTYSPAFSDGDVT